MRKNPHRPRPPQREEPDPPAYGERARAPDFRSGRAYGGFLEGRSGIPGVLKVVNAGEARESVALSLPAGVGPRGFTNPTAGFEGRRVRVRPEMRTRFSALKPEK